MIIVSTFKAGVNPSLWKMIEVFIKFESEMKRTLCSNALGRDLTTNTGRKSLCDANLQQLRCLTNRYKNMPEKEYIALVAHTLATQSSK